jgi:predicted small lipoprotein YifL
MRPAFFLLVVSILALTVGCGQRGDLYLRDNPPPGVRPPKPEVYTPVPYPKESRDDEGASGAKK